jgi:hypothetical protein
MNKRLPREDTLPWYRQFWPWFLIMLPASVVVAGISMVFIANRGADDLVVDEYYKDGLAINRKLEKIDQAASLGVSASLAFAGDQVVVMVEGPVTDPALQLYLSHPLEADRDFTVRLVQSTPGEYRGRLGATVAPRWHWALVSESQPSWRLDGSVSTDDIRAGNGG